MTEEEERLFAELHAGTLPFTSELFERVLAIAQREAEADPERYRDSWLSFLSHTNPPE